MASCTVFGALGLAPAVERMAQVVFVTLDTTGNPQLWGFSLLVIIKRLWRRSGAVGLLSACDA